MRRRRRRYLLVKDRVGEEVLGTIDSALGMRIVMAGVEEVEEVGANGGESEVELVVRRSDGPGLIALSM